MRALIYGGEGGIRTLDTLLTYTHFPGVLLQPLGHFTVIIARPPSGLGGVRYMNYLKKAIPGRDLAIFRFFAPLWHSTNTSVSASNLEITHH